MENILEESLWQIEYFGNVLWEYLVFLIIFLVLSFVFYFFKYLVVRKISGKLMEREISRLFLDVIKKIRSPFYIFIAFYIALSAIEIPEMLSKIFWFILVFWVIYRLVIVGHQFIDFGLRFYLKKREDDEGEAMIRNLGNIAKAILWVFAAIIILSILGVNVTALLAGMGIGGVAIAFALQSILSDLFSSFSIFLDKPFTEGDFIIVGDKSGTVEKIGIKSTRVRALQGEEIVFSNKELTSAQVHNYGEMDYWRADVRLGVVYETPTKKMRRIPDIAKEIIEKEDSVEVQFDRVNFISFGDFSLNYALVYYVKTPSYREFLEVNEKILLNIKQAFEDEDIEFAYPTSTVHLYRQSKE